MNTENNEFFINDVEAEELTLEVKKPSTSKVLYEDTSRRQKNTKHFRLQNGNFMAVMYDKPVHKIDPKTGKVLPEGEKGELVFTALDKEAFPLLRYRTRDICVLYGHIYRRHLYNQMECLGL